MGPGYQGQHGMPRLYQMLGNGHSISAAVCSARVSDTILMLIRAQVDLHAADRLLHWIKHTPTSEAGSALPQWQHSKRTLKADEETQHSCKRECLTTIHIFTYKTLQALTAGCRVQAGLQCSSSHYNHAVPAEVNQLWSPQSHVQL